MRDYVNEHFTNYPLSQQYERYGKGVRPAIICADGTVLSIQASEDHHCHPKNNEGPYKFVEVLQFNRDGKQRTKYPESNVAVEFVNRRIRRHGGLLSMYDYRMSFGAKHKESVNES